MDKPGFLFLFAIFTSAVFADASVKSKGQVDSFLLVAPGTLSGVVKAPQQKNEPVPPVNFIEPKQYRYIPDHYKFPQYGQLRGQDNPWLDRTPRQRNLPSSQGVQSYSNPWDISNLPSLGPETYRRPVTGSDLQTPGFGAFGREYSSSTFDPAFPTTLDHGLAPSATGFPFMDGMMPGLGKDDSGFPFLPFDMF